MRQGRPNRQRLAALAVLGVVLLSFPVLSLPTGVWFGLPAVFVYIFAAWAGLIGFAAFLIEREEE